MMTYKLKVLAAALMALAALGALGAVGASAQFESEAQETQLTISSNEMQKFKIKAGSSLTLECGTIAIENAVIEGEGTEATTIDILPAVAGCNNVLGQPVEIDTNGCHFVFHSGEGETSGTVDVECPEAPMRLTIGSLCYYSIATQTGLGSIQYSNIGEGTTREVRASPQLTGITTTKTGSFLCPAGSSEGTYSGDVVITGEEPGTVTHVGLYVD